MVPILMTLSDPTTSFKSPYSSIANAEYGATIWWILASYIYSVTMKLQCDVTISYPYECKIFKYATLFSMITITLL